MVSKTLSSVASESLILHRGQQRFFDLQIEASGGLDIPAAVLGDLPQSAGSVVRSDRVTVHALLLGTLHSERLTREVQVPLARSAEEADHIQQIR